MKQFTRNRGSAALLWVAIGCDGSDQTCAVGSCGASAGVVEAYPDAPGAVVVDGAGQPQSAPSSVATLGERKDTSLQVLSEIVSVDTLCDSTEAGLEAKLAAGELVPAPTSGACIVRLLKFLQDNVPTLGRWQEVPAGGAQLDQCLARIEATSRFGLPSCPLLAGLSPDLGSSAGGAAGQPAGGGGQPAGGGGQPAGGGGQPAGAGGQPAGAEGQPVGAGDGSAAGGPAVGGADFSLLCENIQQTLQERFDAGTLVIPSTDLGCGKQQSDYLRANLPQLRAVLAQPGGAAAAAQCILGIDARDRFSFPVCVLGL